MHNKYYESRKTKTTYILERREYIISGVCFAFLSVPCHYGFYLTVKNSQGLLLLVGAIKLDHD